MTTGIIASTQLELNMILSKITLLQMLTVHNKNFYKGFFNNYAPIVACLSGIGKVNASHGITLMMERFKPDIIYVIGVGGAYPASKLQIGDIAIATKEIYGDEGLSLRNSFHTMDELGLPLLKTNGSSYFNEFPMYIPDYLLEFENKGVFITVSSCTGSLDKATEIEQRFNAICENMEGAAIAHICTLYKIPVVEIRGISNIIEERKAEPLNIKDLKTASDKVQSFFLSCWRFF